MAISKKAIIEYGFRIFVSLAIFYPLGIAIADRDWAFNSTILINLFPLFGILAFVLLWLHAICGVFERWLRKYIDFDRFVSMTASTIFVCIILHPLLLLIQLNFNILPLFTFRPLYIWLAIIGWLLLLTYDIAKPLKKRYQFFSRNWNKILLISNIGFLITFFHSLGLGDDLQSGPLRTVWIFYGITAILAIVWTYGIDRSWQQ